MLRAAEHLIQENLESEKFTKKHKSLLVLRKAKDMSSQFVVAQPESAVIEGMAKAGGGIVMAAEVSEEYMKVFGKYDQARLAGNQEEDRRARSE